MSTYTTNGAISPSPSTSPRSSKAPVIKAKPIGYKPGDFVTSLSSVNYDKSRERAVKASLLVFDSFCRNGNSFGTQAVGRYFQTTDVLWMDDQDKPVGTNSDHASTRAKYVATITVNKDMCNVLGILHGGCVSYMFDIITTAALVQATGTTKVSINMNTSFFRSVSVGTQLKIIGYSASIGKSIAALGGEMWDIDNSTLIARCSHTMTDPPAPQTTSPARSRL